MKSTLQIVAADPEAGLRAFVFVDSLIDGRALGGTRMTGTVTLDEGADLAHNKMTLKLALAGIPIGVQAGSVCDRPPSRERDRQLAAFGLYPLAVFAATFGAARVREHGAGVRPFDPMWEQP